MSYAVWLTFQVADLLAYTQAFGLAAAGWFLLILAVRRPPAIDDARAWTAMLAPLGAWAGMLLMGVVFRSDGEGNDHVAVQWCLVAIAPAVLLAMLLVALRKPRLRWPLLATAPLHAWLGFNVWFATGMSVSGDWL